MEFTRTRLNHDHDQDLLNRLPSIRAVRIFFSAIMCLLVGCRSLTHLSGVHTARESYSGGKNMMHFRPMGEGFTFDAPDTWGMYVEELTLDGPGRKMGSQVNIRNYEWSPIIQFDRLREHARWEDDLPRVDAILTRAKTITDLQVSGSLTRYNKFSGHGLRKVGMGDGRRSEYILFYPADGEMEGTRILVILYGSPSPAALREMDALIGSVRFDPKKWKD